MSEEGRQATLQHRARQLAIRSAVGRQITSVWRTEFDVSDIAGSSLRFSTAASPIIEEGRRRSAEVAADYFSTYRQVAGPGPRRARPLINIDGRRIQQSLGYASKIVPLKAISNGDTAVRAARAGLQQSIGTAGRLTREGGRETLTQAVEDDVFARGWQRVTGPEPCEFCAMLSARGGVYRKGTAAFEAHNWCQCEAEPMYSSERWLSPQQQELKELYDRYAKGNKHPLRAFRAEMNAQNKL